jgi:hypothetical protein
VAKVGRAGGAAPADATTDAQSTGSRPPLLGRLGRTLLLLFPQAPAVQRSRRARTGIVVGTVAAIAAGAWLMLERQQGRPATASLVAEDYKTFLPGALAHPLSSLFQAYDGYLELLPRLLAEVIAKLPFRDAAVAFAISGAVITACCAVFMFYASSGHIRTLALRVALAASVILLPTSLVEIANTGVNSPWFLLGTAFWALIWRPRTLAGALTAAVLCFFAASSNALAALYLPLVVARVIALPRLREQVVSIGWLAGGLLQIPAVLTLSRNSQPTTLVHLLAFYGHLVILPAVAGHRIASALWGAVGLTGATLIATAVVVAVGVWACVWAGPRARMFVLATLFLGLLLCLVPVYVHGNVANVPLYRTQLYVRGSRYAQSPILLLYSGLFVAVDAYLRRGGFRLEQAARAAVVVLLVAVLGTVWVSDFRYANTRAIWQPWSVTVARVQRHCLAHPQRPVHVLHVVLPCSRFVGISARK